MSFKALRLQKGGKLRALGYGPESEILECQLLGEQAQPRGAGQRPCSPVTLSVWGPPEPGEGHAHCTNQNPLGSNEGWKSRQESWSSARPKTWEWPGLKPSSATSRTHDPSQTTSALNLCFHICKVEIIEPTSSDVMRIKWVNCYQLKAVYRPPPPTLPQSLILRLMLSRGGNSWKWLSHKAEAIMNGLSSLMNETPENTFTPFCHGRTQ